MSTPTISVEEAKQDKLFYVVASIIIVNTTDKTCLLLKRGDNEKVHPGKWAFPGGKLEHADIAKEFETGQLSASDAIENVFGKLAAREGKEECGLDVDAGSAVITQNKVFIRPDGVPVMLVILATTYAGGEVELEEDAFTDFAWVTRERLGDYDVIEDIKEEAEEALDLLAS